MVQSCGQLKCAVGACGDEIGTLSESAIGKIADCLDLAGFGRQRGLVTLH